MTTDDESLLALYNKELIALSSRTLLPRHLNNPDVIAHAVSPICGSEVNIELRIKDGVVTDFGYEVDACALTRTVVAIMDAAIRGKTRTEIVQAEDSLRSLLLEEISSPLPNGWKDLSLLRPVKNYTARHNAILLPFEAVERAFKKTEIER